MRKIGSSYYKSTDIRNSLRNSQADTDPEYTWYRISIPHGKKMGKNFVLKSITSSCKVPFTPYNYEIHNATAVFYVTGYQTANAIKDVHKRITTPDGFKMSVNVTESPPPIPSIDEGISEKIKTVMSKHYDSMIHKLDLSTFHSDNDLCQEGIYVPISRRNVMSCVVQIIKEHIPLIQQLDLSKNRLNNLEDLAPLVTVCKNLKILILKNNKLKRMAVLDALKGLDLVELTLDGNPLCDNYKDQSTYISAVREKFPKIIKLDGQDLPAPILFSLETHEVLPSSKESSFPSEDVKNIVVQFLEQYYTIYDSSDRQPLLEAYHDQAMFSMSVVRNAQSPRDGGKLQDYISDSRNLMRVLDPNLRHKLLRQGKLSIVSALSEMPKTQHDPNSFTVDVSYVSQALMCFTVTGVFKEVNSKINNVPLRTFSRTFVVIPQGQGFSIINEMLYITNATAGQNKAYKMVAPTPTPSPAPSNERTAEEQQQMVIEFSKQTGMNFDFSAKCLDENDWDFQKAATVFQTLNERGSIPVEAFQKT
ncbi:nuclear RNA export factor 1-like [Centruroides sculpturatus]|uniref:nuclear RNA export factor 1-like n=1 Tax=Centruroides sculpturatus TaxID=218467 RepID=UPI000C6E78F9|nr:nuclear RNA export factor 1-like [Centruroides sculpturatus]